LIVDDGGLFLDGTIRSTSGTTARQPILRHQPELGLPGYEYYDIAGRARYLDVDQVSDAPTPVPPTPTFTRHPGRRPSTGRSLRYGQ
jgi:hypothetical protein